MSDCNLTLPCSSICTDCSSSGAPAFQINNPFGVAINGFGLTGGLTGGVDPDSSGTAVQGSTVRGIGVLGTSTQGSGVVGTGGDIGVQGDSFTGRAGSFQLGNELNDNVALYAETRGRGPAIEGMIINSANNNQPAVRGVTDGSGAAVQGRTTGAGRAGSFEIDSSENNQAALRGSTTGTGPGVVGTSSRSAGVSGSSTGGLVSVGVSGSSSDGLFSIGVFGTSTGGLVSVGVYGRATGQNARAAIFDGPVDVTGFLEKSGGGFKIDHPLEPANKHLRHSFVESPEMKNVYDGVIGLDEKGEAVVALPEWFEALNRDFRYQLTCLGHFAPVYIAEEVSRNRFKIAGGKPGMKISWQVTGSRKDSWAQAHPLVVEEDKPENERGFYRHPELYGSDLEHSIYREVRNPELTRQLWEPPQNFSSTNAPGASEAGDESSPP